MQEQKRFYRFMVSNSLVEGKVALVTGSTRGIGWAAARTLAHHGAKVIINGRSSPELLEQRVKELNEINPDCATGMLFDVSDFEKSSDAYKQIFSKFKRLDILVNNAGVLGDALLGMISESLIRDTFSVNACCPLWHLQNAARLMGRNKSGSIINVSSIIGVRGNVGQSVYAASKAALIGLTLSAAKELAPHNIRVNAITPGFIDTDMARSIPKEKFNERLASIAMKRIGQPEEVAKVILFLGSEMSSYVTGQVLGVDGGFLI